MNNERPSIDKARRSLETADAVARATHLWTRSISLNDTERPAERFAFAGGLITGLSEHLTLNPAIRELVAYVYTLLDDEGEQALCVSRMMLELPVPTAERLAYEQGRGEAAGIVAMLASAEPSLITTDPSGPTAGPNRQSCVSKNAYRQHSTKWRML